jgi:putative membrane protein
MRRTLKMRGVVIAFSSILLLLSFKKNVDSFFNKASQANLARIKAGRLAVERGNPEVKKIGQEMVADYTTAETELVTLAKKKGIGVVMTPDASHIKILAELESMHEKRFDSAYMAGQLSDQTYAIALFSEESKNGTDPEAKAYAGKYLPKWQIHLQKFEGNNSAMKRSMDSTAK